MTMFGYFVSICLHDYGT